MLFHYYIVEKKKKMDSWPGPPSVPSLRVLPRPLAVLGGPRLPPLSMCTRGNRRVCLVPG